MKPICYFLTMLSSFWRFLKALNEVGAVPSSLTDDYDAVLTSTARAMQPVIRDNIHRGNKFLAWLNSKGRFRSQDGGERVQVPLMYAKNSTADIYQGYGTLDTTPQDGITSAFYPWAQISVSTSISGLEKKKNKGKSRLLPLWESKLRQSEISAKELLNNCIVAGRITASAAKGQFLARIGRLDTSATGPLPIGNYVDTDPTRSTAIGNINGGTYSWWRNQQLSTSGTTFAALKQGMMRLYSLCSKGTGGPPDFILSDSIYFETYFNALQSQERYVRNNQAVIDVLGGADALQFKGAVMVWDEVVPDAQTNAEVVDAIGTVALSTAYFMNSEAMDFVYESDTNWEMTPQVRPENQDAFVMQTLWMGAIGPNNRRKHGVHYNISQAITS